MEEIFFEILRLHVCIYDVMNYEWKKLVQEQWSET